MVRHPVLLSVVIPLWAACARGGDGQDWPRFRGPDGAGISTATSVPVQWTEQDYAWRIQLPGTGHSSPVTWGDKLFVTCCDKKTAARIALGLKAADGSEAWRREFPSKRHPLNRMNSYASSSPAVDARHVYLYWTTPEEVTVVALDHAGKDVWRRSLGSFESEHGGGISPIVLDGLLVVANDQKGKSSLIALDCGTGETRWQIDRRSAKAAYATPIIYRPDGAPPELIVMSMAQGVTSVDPRTGTTRWELADAFPLRVVASAVVADGLIVGTCQNGGVGRRLVAVRPGGSPPGTPAKLVYERKKDIPAIPTPIARDGLLFLWTDRGVVTCLRAATGEQVWQERIDDRFAGSPIWVAGRLYCMSRKGTCYVVAAAEEFEILARNPLGEGSQATPAVGRGVLYLRTLSHLIAIGGRQ